MASRNDQLAKLKKLQEQGIWRFVLVRGVLGWGLGTAVIYSLIMWTVLDINFGKLLLALLIFPVCGLLWGALVWWLIDRKCQQQALLGDS